MGLSAQFFVSICRNLRMPECHIIKEFNSRTLLPLIIRMTRWAPAWARDSKSFYTFRPFSRNWACPPIFVSFYRRLRMSEYHSSKLLPRISTQGLSPTAERPGELQHGPGVVSSLHLQALSPHRQTGLVPFSLFSLQVYTDAKITRTFTQGLFQLPELSHFFLSPMGPGLVSSTKVSSHPQETSLPLQNLPLLSHSRITKEVIRENIKKSNKRRTRRAPYGPGLPEDGRVWKASERCSWTWARWNLLMVKLFYA